MRNTISGSLQIDTGSDCNTKSQALFRVNTSKKLVREMFKERKRSCCFLRWSSDDGRDGFLGFD